jgi:hypothetical protein
MNRGAPDRGEQGFIAERCWSYRPQNGVLSSGFRLLLQWTVGALAGKAIAVITSAKMTSGLGCPQVAQFCADASSQGRPPNIYLMMSPSVTMASI